MLRLLDRFTDLPALLVNARLDLLAWNAMATALMGDLSAVAPGERNVAWRRFVSGDRVGPDPAEQARVNRSLVAQLRDTAAQYPDDPELRGLVARLRAGSAEFARLWDERRLSEPGGDRKSFLHPDVGGLTLDCDVLRVPGDDHRLIVYSASEGSRDAEALNMLRILDAQRLAHT